MNKKQFWLFYLGYAVIVLATVFASMRYCSTVSETQLNGDITNKYEVGDKCFVEIQVEVSPEQYIGYDIGDEFTVE